MTFIDDRFFNIYFKEHFFDIMTNICLPNPHAFSMYFWLCSAFNTSLPALCVFLSVPLFVFIVLVIDDYHIILTLLRKASRAYLACLYKVANLFLMSFF